MIYHVNELALMPIREQYSGPDNDLVICEDMREEKKAYYTVLLIKNHELARKVLKVLESGKRNGQCYLDIFTVNDGFGIVFPYIRERYLTDFYMDSQFSLEACETICINLIMECLSSPMPYPLLYLLLMERQIYLRADNNVQLGYPLNLSLLDENAREEDCAVVCASVVRDLLRRHGDEEAASYQLLTRKVKKRAYRKFTDLYYDVKMTAINPDNKKDLKGKIKGLKGNVKEKSPVLFRILLAICIILVILALISIISMLAGGRIPLLRFFSNNFKVIGTESLLK